MRIAIFALAVLAGGSLRRLGKSSSYRAARAILKSLLGAGQVRTVSKRLPILRRAIAAANSKSRGARYMCGRGPSSAALLANE